MSASRFGRFQRATALVPLDQSTTVGETPFQTFIMSSGLKGVSFEITGRYKTVVTQYQTTRHVEEALFRLTEAYMTIGIVAEAQTAAAVLGHNFPDSRWYKDAYNLVKSGGLEPSENQGSWMSRAFKRIGL